MVEILSVHEATDAGLSWSKSTNIIVRTNHGQFHVLDDNGNAYISVCGVRYYF